jgi:hypothetical protein
MRQALQWHLLLENPADGVKIPLQPRGEMRALTVEQAQTFLKAAMATPHGPVLAVALTTGMVILCPEAHALSLSTSDMPARPSRWTLMLTCCLTCRMRLPQTWRQCSLERGATVAEVAVLGTRYEQHEALRLYASRAEIGCVIQWFHALLFSFSRLPTIVERTGRDHKGSCGVIRQCSRKLFPFSHLTGMDRNLSFSTSAQRLLRPNLEHLVPHPNTILPFSTGTVVIAGTDTTRWTLPRK